MTVRNEAVDEFWRKQGSCKATAHVGFFVAPGGFTESLDTEIRDFRKEGVVLVPIDREGLERLVRASNRSDVLEGLHMAAAIAT